MKVCTFFPPLNIVNCNFSPIDAHYYRSCHPRHHRHYCCVDRKGNTLVLSRMLKSVIRLMRLTVSDCLLYVC